MPRRPASHQLPPAALPERERDVDGDRLAVGRDRRPRHAAALLLPATSRTSPASPFGRSRTSTPCIRTSTRSTSNCTIRACAEAVPPSRMAAMKRQKAGQPGPPKNALSQLLNVAYHCCILLGGSGSQALRQDVGGLEEDGAERVTSPGVCIRTGCSGRLCGARRTAADGLCTCVARRRGTRRLLRCLHARSRLRSLVDGDPGHPNHHLAAERRGTRRAPDSNAADLALVDRARRGGRVDRQRDLVREPASLGAWLCRCERGRSNRRRRSFSLQSCRRRSGGWRTSGRYWRSSALGCWQRRSSARRSGARSTHRRQEPIYDGLARVVVG